MTHVEAMRRVVAAFDAPDGMPEFCKAIDDMRQAIAEAEQAQPVAWQWKERINGDFDSWVISASEPPPYAIEKQPLYTAPPQRLPLTDEVIEEIDRWIEFKEEGGGRIPTAKLVRYIEAKLKEKT